MLNYIRTHACQTDDRRPDTNNIPTRTMGVCLQPQLRSGRAQFGGCKLQRESERKRQ